MYDDTTIGLCCCLKHGFCWYCICCNDLFVEKDSYRQ